jgi:hypothetical protein
VKVGTLHTALVVVGVYSIYGSQDRPFTNAELTTERKR